MPHPRPESVLFMANRLNAAIQECIRRRVDYPTPKRRALLGAKLAALQSVCEETEQELCTLVESGGFGASPRARLVEIADRKFSLATGRGLQEYLAPEGDVRISPLSSTPESRMICAARRFLDLIDSL